MSVTIQRLFARLLVIIMGIVAVFTGGNMNNIQLELKNEVTTETEIVEVQIFNYTGKTITTDKYISLEKNENGEWVKVDFAEDYAFEEIGIIMRNLQTVNLTINLVKAFGKTLDAGEYRLTKEVATGVNSSVTFTVNAA